MLDNFYWHDNTKINGKKHWKTRNQNKHENFDKASIWIVNKNNTVFWFIYLLSRNCHERICSHMTQYHEIAYQEKHVSIEKTTNKHLFIISYVIKIWTWT